MTDNTVCTSSQLSSDITAVTFNDIPDYIDVINLSSHPCNKELSCLVMTKKKACTDGTLDCYQMKCLKMNVKDISDIQPEIDELQSDESFISLYTAQNTLACGHHQYTLAVFGVNVFDQHLKIRDYNGEVGYCTDAENCLGIANQITGSCEPICETSGINADFLAVNSSTVCERPIAATMDSLLNVNETYSTNIEDLSTQNTTSSIINSSNSRELAIAGGSTIAGIVGATLIGSCIGAVIYKLYQSSIYKKVDRILKESRGVEETYGRLAAKLNLPDELRTTYKGYELLVNGFWKSLRRSYERPAVTFGCSRILENPLSKVYLEDDTARIIEMEANEELDTVL